jgi:REP element-mobilizing transposase RayT
MSPASSRLRVGRSSAPGQHYLLTTCCATRRPVLLHGRSAELVLDSAHWLERNARLKLIAIMVMPDHVHLVVELREHPLSQVVHSFKSHTAHAIKKLLDLSEPVWQAGYHDRGIRDEPALKASVEYCLHNPVRAGLVDDFHQYPHYWCRWPV